MSDIRVLIADDHALFRAGLRALLSGLERIEVVGEAADGVQALDLIAERRPDLALLDIAMPRLNGLEVAARVAAEHPATRVLILSMHSDNEYVRRAVRSGAAGYLLKDSGATELEMAIRAVARGESYLSPAVSAHLVADYRRFAGGDTPSENVLTPRQREILRAIAEGRTTKTIARELGISVKTVETHRALLMERLGIHDVPGLVRYAIRHGLIKPDE
jgi:DNA-binding NarL/FixJ family response regulator